MSAVTPAALEDVLCRYPPPQYVLQMQVMDLLSLCPGRLRVLTALARAGKLDDAVLALDQPPMMVCTAELRMGSADGPIVRTAYAVRSIASDEDMGELQSSALLRLLPSSGVSETAAPTQQQEVPAEASAVIPVSSAAPLSKAAVPVKPVPAAPRVIAKVGDQSSNVTASVRRKIESLASALGQPSPKLLSTAHAMQLLTDMGAKLKAQQNAAAASRG